ncbi:MAG: hypothetical protein H7Y01_03255 [Ferruginibacter sp.]|nr:hypothetical protein [Chitinophagaceae bacterium]
MKITADQVQNNRAAMFDWIVLATSFSLGFIFPDLGKFVLSPQFSWWMLIALTCYIAGAWLKHTPLSLRLFRKPGREIVYTLFLVAGHWCIFLMVLFFCAPVISKLFGFRAYMEKNQTSGTVIFITMILATVITWLVYRSKVPGKAVAARSKDYLFRRELVADFLLIVGVSILSFVLWEKGVIALLSNKPLTSFGEVWFVFVFLSAAYVLCYLPLRYLFLIEDHGSRRTWRRMLLIFAFLLLKSVFEIFGI